MAPREVELPGTWPTAQPLRRRTVNTIKDNARYAHPSTDDTIEAHYSALEHLRPHGCYDGLVYIGYLAVDPENDEVEIVGTVRCRRCVS